MLPLFNLRSDQSWHYSFQLLKKNVKRASRFVISPAKILLWVYFDHSFSLEQRKLSDIEAGEFLAFKTIFFLFGGWTNPFEKYARQIGNLPQVLGVKTKNLCFSAFCWVNCLMLTLPEKKSLKATPEHWMGKGNTRGGGGRFFPFGGGV